MNEKSPMMKHAEKFCSKTVGLYAHLPDSKIIVRLKKSINSNQIKIETRVMNNRQLNFCCSHFGKLGSSSMSRNNKYISFNML
jgi:hypothetical protein